MIVDSARGKSLTVTQLGLSFLRNLDEKKAPSGMTPLAMLQLFDNKMGGGVAGRGEKPKSEWRITSILSMWFQDLWNYDFRRTELCVIPYGTQEGEISFCAYNTGVGWRSIIEEMRQVATTQDWFAQRGRHQIDEGNRPVPLPKVLRRQLPVVSVESGNGNGNGNGHADAHAHAAEAQGCGKGCGCAH